MTPLTLLLDGGAVPAAEVGGKGFALNRLIEAGVAVPPTGIVTATAYRRFVRESGIENRLRRWRDGATADAAAVERAFLDAPIPGAVRAEILALSDRVRGDGLLAVRSSATAEDMEAASFAGQYLSVLEVGTDEAVIDAVRRVWASLWMPAPRAYRAHAGIADDETLAMAVVVMRLVDARRAGVAFTVDPAGDGSTLRVEAVDGLAEALVSGEVTPDAWSLSRILPRRPQVDPVINCVVDAALAIERHFGTPQDVEWAHDEDQLWIVQARPITTLAPGAATDGFDTPVAADHAFTTAGIAEMLPGVLSPLVWTSVRAPLEEGFRRLFGGLDALPGMADRAAFVARVRGRAVLNLDLLKAAAREVPGGSAAEIERQYFGRVVTEDDDHVAAAEKRRFEGLRTMLAGVREISARRAYLRDAAIVVESIERLARRPPDCHVMSSEDLLAYRHRVVDLATRAFVAEVAVAAAAANAYRGVELFLEPHVGADAPTAAQHLTAGGINPCGAQLALHTCDIAHEALTDRGLQDVLEPAATAEEIGELVRTSDRGAALRKVVDSELAQAGSASVFAGPTWAESDDLAWNLVTQAIHTELSGRREMVTAAERLDRLAEVESRFARSWKYRLQRIMTGQIVDARRRLLRRLVFDAVEFLGMRERTKSAVLLLGGELRRIHLALGHRLYEAGVLETPLGVDLLAAAELEDAVGGSPPTPWELRRRAEALARLGQLEPLPQIFTGDPDRPAITADSDADHYVGWAASGGTYEGPARVITDASQPLTPGDVLVARTTDPAWTPLFLTAGAIVVEQGGPLSHAAIIARELKLPAVLNVPGLVGRIGTAQVRLRVDGDHGTVTVLDGDRAPVRHEAAVTT